jgi:hypothetical protein
MKNYKISGVELTESFIGKPVAYIPNHARTENFGSRELGTIMHWNEYGVMVDYGYNKCRTRFEDLILV